MNLKLSEIRMKEYDGNKKAYKKELKALQYEMLNLQQHLFNQKVGLIIVFEGMDAAGKGGAIKRVTERLDPRGLFVHPIAAPQPHEKRFHYLHRFWRKLPQHGQIGIFDRSWYGRVLVERIEEYATKDEWQRSYQEINDFEKLLTDESYIMVKCWMQITEEEQLTRFTERQDDPYKQWKLTEEDWRNREKWSLYIEAAQDMLEKTHKNYAPWIVVGGNDKNYARIYVLKAIIQHIMQVCANRDIPYVPHQEDVSQGEEA